MAKPLSLKSLLANAEPFPKCNPAGWIIEGTTLLERVLLSFHAWRGQLFYVGDVKGNPTYLRLAGAERIAKRNSYD